MSGGAFDYKQHNFIDIADEIERVISQNADSEYRFDDKTIARFHEGVKALQIANAYVDRIDWLLSYDDSEETFNERLNSDLKEIK